jgi:dipeptidyl aminopeptidase/acylaminoacyl peptidase
MTTPLLIIHSEEDYRCPIEQSEQLFVSLKMLQRTVEFVRFPGESHGLSRMGKPVHRVERLQAILGWFEEYL